MYKQHSPEKEARHALVQSWKECKSSSEGFSALLGCQSSKDSQKTHFHLLMTKIITNICRLKAEKGSSTHSNRGKHLSLMLLSINQQIGAFYLDWNTLKRRLAYKEYSLKALAESWVLALSSSENHCCHYTFITINATSDHETPCPGRTPRKQPAWDEGLTQKEETWELISL